MIQVFCKNFQFGLNFLLRMIFPSRILLSASLCHFMKADKKLELVAKQEFYIFMHYLKLFQSNALSLIESWKFSALLHKFSFHQCAI